MDMIKCSECGEEITDNVTVCPHCGYPVEDDSTNSMPEDDILTPADTEPNETINNDEEISSNTKNTTASILNFIGSSILFLGTIGSFAMSGGSEKNYEFTFSVFVIYEFATILSGFIVLGMAQIIQLLHEINRKLKITKSDPS